MLSIRPILVEKNGNIPYNVQINGSARPHRSSCLCGNGGESERKGYTIMKKLLLTALLVLALAVLPVVAGAKNEDVMYLDVAGIEQTQTGCEVIQGTRQTTETTMTAGWYALSGEIVYSGPLKIQGDVHLILKNHTKVDAQCGIVVSDNSRLTIYAQSKGRKMGRLIAKGQDQFAGIMVEDSHSSLTINGGYIEANGGRFGGAGIGGSAYGTGGNCATVTINGGVVTAVGGDMGGAGIGGGTGIDLDTGYKTASLSNDGGNGGKVTINSGLVTAIGGGEYGVAIGGGYGKEKRGTNGSLTFGPKSGRSIAVFDDATDTLLGTFTSGNQIDKVSGKNKLCFETHGGYGMLDDYKSVPVGSGTGVSLRADGDYDAFAYARRDNKKLNENAYTATEGSTIAALKAAYTNTLSVGDYMLNFIYTDGSADGHFRVIPAPAENPASAAPNLPQTGDGSGLLLWAALAALCALGAAALWAGRCPRRGRRGS